MKLALFALCGLLLVPAVGSAYEVTDTDVVRLSNDTVLFSISYKFGFLNREMLMPIHTVYGDTLYSDRTSYQIESAGEVLTAPIAPAIVLTDSDVERRGNQYYLPAGKSGEFTFISILRLDDSTAHNALKASITNLPFTMINGETETLGMVLAEELPDYATDSITMSDDITVITAEPVFTPK